MLPTQTMEGINGKPCSKGEASGDVTAGYTRTYTERNMKWGHWMAILPPDGTRWRWVNNFMLRPIGTGEFELGGSQIWYGRFREEHKCNRATGTTRSDLKARIGKRKMNSRTITTRQKHSHNDWLIDRRNIASADTTLCFELWLAQQIYYLMSVIYGLFA
jgi:hypothetical protein